MMAKRLFSGGRIYLLFAMLVCGLVGGSLLYILFLESINASSIRFESREFRGAPQVVVYKAQPQLNIVGNSDIVRLQCTPFDYDNSCLDSVINSADFGFSDVDVVYLRSAFMPLVNNVVVEVRAGEIYLMRCNDRVAELGVSKNLCVQAKGR